MKIKNYKSFKNWQEITFAPITILVGPNSGGKSSILKLLGLLAQTYSENSFEMEYKGSIVDLKDFESIANDVDLPVEIKFITPSVEYDRYLQYKYRGLIDQISIMLKRDMLSIDYEEIRSESNCELRKHFRNNTYVFTENNIKNINNELDEIKNKFLDILIKVTRLSSKAAENKFTRFVKLVIESTQIKVSGLRMRFHEFPKEYMEIPKKLNKYVKDWRTWDSILDSTNIDNYLNTKLLYYNYMKKTFLEFIIDLSSKDNDNKDLDKEIPDDNKKEHVFDDELDIFDNIENNLNKNYHDLYTNILWCYLYENVHKAMDLELKKYEFKNTHSTTLQYLFNNFLFIPPLRMKPKQYYTSQDIINALLGNLSGTSIVSKPHYIIDNILRWNSSVNDQLTVFNLNEEIIIRKIENDKVKDLYTVEIHDKTTDKYYTLDDVGFGFSQLIPILFSLNSIRDSSYNNLVIEQPELHIHPKLQSALASVVVDTINKTDYRNNCIIETHSEYLLRKLLVYVAKGEIKPRDISVNYIDKDSHGVSTIKRMNIDDHGFFKEKWPEGFFDNTLKLNEEIWDARKKVKK